MKDALRDRYEALVDESTDARRRRRGRAFWAGHEARCAALRAECASTGGHDMLSLGGDYPELVCIVTGASPVRCRWCEAPGWVD